MRHRTGFSLIELMIVIAIIGILVAVALPQFSAMTEDAKRSKAKHDTSEVARAVSKFISLEGKMLESLMELKGRYMSNIDTLRDPWGKPYLLDIVNGLVVSCGPDGKHSPSSDKTWKDDVATPYMGALTLLEAKLEVDPDPNTDATTAYDRLFLVFNKGIDTADASIDLGPATSSGQDRDAYSAFEDGDARAGKILRWYEGARPKFRAGYSPFPDGTLVGIYRTNDPRVLCLPFPPGFTEVFKTTTWINLTGAKKDPNPFFRGMGSSAGAESSGSPVCIKACDKDPYQVIGFVPGQGGPVVIDADGFGLAQPFATPGPGEEEE